MLCAKVTKQYDHLGTAMALHVGMKWCQCDHDHSSQFPLSYVHGTFMMKGLAFALVPTQNEHLIGCKYQIRQSTILDFNKTPKVFNFLCGPHSSLTHQLMEKDNTSIGFPTGHRKLSFSLPDSHFGTSESWLKHNISKLCVPCLHPRLNYMPFLHLEFTADDVGSLIHIPSLLSSSRFFSKKDFIRWILDLYVVLNEVKHSFDGTLFWSGSTKNLFFCCSGNKFGHWMDQIKP